MIEKLPPKLGEWLRREAGRVGVTEETLAKALLIDAIELAIEEEADLRCKQTTNAFERTPLPQHWQVRVGSPLTPKIVSGFAVRARGSASAGTSSGK